MKRIQLNKRKRHTSQQGLFALVDDENYEWLNQWNWSASRKGLILYAERKYKTNGKEKGVLMHRLIMGIADQPNKFIDHIDMNGLNNQKPNLRFATKSENGRNRGSIKNKTSRFKGVSIYKKNGKWRAAIIINGKQKSLGHFYNEMEAAQKYDEAAKIHHGEFAKLNF